MVGGERGLSRKRRSLVKLPNQINPKTPPLPITLTKQSEEECSKRTFRLSLNLWGTKKNQYSPITINEAVKGLFNKYVIE